MVVGMAHQWRVHFEQRLAAKTALEDLDGVGHRQEQTVLQCAACTGPAPSGLLRGGVSPGPTTPTPTPTPTPTQSPLQVSHPSARAGGGSCHLYSQAQPDVPARQRGLLENPPPAECGANGAHHRPLRPSWANLASRAWPGARRLAGHQQSAGLFVSGLGCSSACVTSNWNTARTAAANRRSSRPSWRGSRRPNCSPGERRPRLCCRALEQHPKISILRTRLHVMNIAVSAKPVLRAPITPLPPDARRDRRGRRVARRRTAVGAAGLIR